MIKGEILLVVCSARVLSNGCKSQVSPNSGNYIAKGKGVHRELESVRRLAGGTCRIALPASMQSGEPTVTGNKGDVTREGEVLVIPTQKGERIIIRWP